MRTALQLLLLALAQPPPAAAMDAVGWKHRSVYQVLTDRFALAEGSRDTCDDPGCEPPKGYGNYCVRLCLPASRAQQCTAPPPAAAASAMFGALVLGPSTMQHRCLAASPRAAAAGRGPTLPTLPVSIPVTRLPGSACVPRRA
jgi:hypothetical protein